MQIELTKVKAQGYSSGYAAGKKAGELKFKELQAQQRKSSATPAQQRNNYNRAFLVSLSVALTQSGWKQGEKSGNALDERVQLARTFATEAAKVML
jgi:flagellar biosynthesis/type III secretory pathway protein FliH